MIKEDSPVLEINQGFITNNSYLGSKISNDETAIKTEDNTLNKEFGFLIKNKLKKIKKDNDCSF